MFLMLRFSYIHNVNNVNFIKNLYPKLQRQPKESFIFYNPLPNE